MNIRFQTPLLFVKDVKGSRAFYENILQQKIEYDFGEDVVFHGGFAIHDANHISQLLFKRPNPFIDDNLGKENFELYFECDDLDGIFSQLVDQKVVFIHTVKEQPWGQRVFRFYDPDNHIVEIGEPMPIVIRRFLTAGASETEVAKRTSMPIVEIVKIKSEIDNNI
ncbi:VOC family protein [Chloroflexota bacterium]